MEAVSKSDYIHRELRKHIKVFIYHYMHNYSTDDFPLVRTLESMREKISRYIEISGRMYFKDLENSIYNIDYELEIYSNGLAKSFLIDPVDIKDIPEERFIHFAKIFEHKHKDSLKFETTHYWIF